MEKEASFYDFVPYKFGPFSFTLYWELRSLRQNGYVTPEEEQIALCEHHLHLAEDETKEVPLSVQGAVAEILDRYGQLNQDALVRTVYTRYPWFAQNSELPERRLAPVQVPRKAPVAVYTCGYEGRSVDAFLNNILKRGIELVLDVRANPVSRKYGFSGSRLKEFCKKLGLQYHHVPSLGIPSASRIGLNSFASYQRLLNQYEQTILSERVTAVEAVGRLMRCKPSVLVCVEKDVCCCHRSRLARAVAQTTGLEVVHL
jgi:uncharacterized protein (DUF488 family)